MGFLSKNTDWMDADGHQSFSWFRARHPQPMCNLPLDRLKFPGALSRTPIKVSDEQSPVGLG